MLFMPEELENKVEKILVKKSHLAYGIIIGTISIAGVFYKIQLDQALTHQKLDTLITEVTRLETTLTLEQNSQDAKIAVLHDEVLKLLDGSGQ